MANVRKPQAIFIGSDKVASVISGLLPEWNFLPTERSIRDFEHNFDTGKISEDIEIIMTTDKFFDHSGRSEDLQKIAARMSPYCLFIIICYDPSNKDIISEKIGDAVYTDGGVQSTNVYYVGKRGTAEAIRRASDTFIKNHNPEAEEAALIIDGREIDDYDDSEVEPTDQEIELEKARNVKSNYLGQVVCSTSSKGGSGKSTVAITLATLMAHSSYKAYEQGLADRPLKICLLDLDIRDGQVGFFTGYTNPTIFHIFKQDNVTAETVKSGIISSDSLKIDLILAPRKPRSANEMPPAFFLEVIAELKKMYDYVIIDTSVNYTDPLLEEVAYPVADLIVMVTEIVQTSIYSMTRWISEVTTPKSRGGMGIPKEKIGIVVNKSLANVSMDKDKIRTNSQGLRIITAIPSNQRLIAHATNINRMASLLQQDAIRVSYMRLAKAIVGNRWPLPEPV